MSKLSMTQCLIQDLEGICAFCGIPREILVAHLEKSITGYEEDFKSGKGEYSSWYTWEEVEVNCPLSELIHYVELLHYVNKTAFLFPKWSELSNEIKEMVSGVLKQNIAGGLFDKNPESSEEFFNGMMANPSFGAFVYAVVGRDYDTAEDFFFQPHAGKASMVWVESRTQDQIKALRRARDHFKNG